jgi:hypothetical protein
MRITAILLLLTCTACSPNKTEVAEWWSNNHWETKGNLRTKTKNTEDIKDD